MSAEQEQSDIVAALRWLAVVNEAERETVLTDHEAYGFGVILKMLADKVERLTL